MFFNHNWDGTQANPQTALATLRQGNRSDGAIVMAQLPVVPNLKIYRGSKENLRRKADEHNAMLNELPTTSTRWSPTIPKKYNGTCSHRSLIFLRGGDQIIDGDPKSCAGLIEVPLAQERTEQRLSACVIAVAID